MRYLLNILIVAIIYNLGRVIANKSKSTFFDDYFIGAVSGIVMVYIYIAVIAHLL
ncbi:TPA: hypothetical protein PTV74_003121 [Clostridium botulinum]|nr:hypothetical protein [Clostridium botulinum]HDK7206276.1 hypothetical protein [Clostridium botulinum]HDK7210012.1 hypothetical protein [Clostridium botulinum]HDK7265461.1 hypothetical protein [Clostridium botulinum]HDK7269309.1 hypothetical protein [Clostridium botulinum]